MCDLRSLPKAPGRDPGSPSGPDSHSGEVAAISFSFLNAATGIQTSLELNDEPPRLG